MRIRCVLNIVASSAFLCLLSPMANAQSATQLVGTWRLVSTTNTNAQGAATEPFGPHPLGSYTFDANGHFTQVIVPGEKGTAKDIVAMFGDYSLSDGGKTLSRHIIGSQNADVIGKTLPVEIVISEDELKVSNPSTSNSASVRASAVWKRVK